MSSSAPVLASVIVTTKNSARTIERCLVSIRAQSCSTIELIVVDNFSTDATLAIARGHADFVIEAGPERCAQRNIGVKAASGRFVLIADSDMYLREDVIAKCIEALGEGNIAAAIPEESIGAGFWAKCKAFERSFYQNDQIISAARFFARETYDLVGGYDETLVSGEDWDISMRAEQLGVVAIADTLILHDEGALRLSTLVCKKFYYGRHIRRFFQKHGSAAARRLNPLRGSYFKSAERFLDQPLLCLGMISMRFCEMAAGGAGLLFALIKAA